jgi:glycosyltransferase involved in cell wall biosynthesis
VSVVIICWNQGRFLGDAIASVLPQVAARDQVVVVDDGSTDSTAAVAAAFPGVRYLRQANAGPSSARNAGLGAVETPFVLFLDADDMLTPGALAAALEALRQAPEAAFAYGGYREVTADGELLFEAAPDPRGGNHAGLLSGNHIAMHGTVLYRTAVLREAGGFDPQLRSCEDYDVYLRLSASHPVAVYASVAAEYRRHGENTTGDAALMLRNALRVMRRHRPGLAAPVELHAAYREGLQFWRDYYGERLLGQLRRELKAKDRRALLRSLATGFRADPGFASRLCGRAVARLGR